MLLLIKGRLFLTVSLLFSKFIYKMGNSIEAPLYHSTWMEWYGESPVELRQPTYTVHLRFL